MRSLQAVLPAVLCAVLVVATAPAPVGAQEAGVPEWLTYQRPAEYEVVVEEDIQVPTRDGSALSCDLYRPGHGGAVDEGPFPGVLYQYHGYGVNRTSSDPPDATFLAEHGYVAMQCSVRGTGGSPGEVDPASLQEALDGYDMVEWMAAQPHSTGRIAMIGYSYGALTTHQVAALRPPHLVTIVPQSAWEDPYRDIMYLGGARTADVRGWVLSLLLALNTTGTPPEQQAALVARTAELDATYAEHPLLDDFWRERGVDHAALAASGIPILAFGGWYDLYQRGTPANYQQLRDQTWLVMQPAAHLDSEYFGSADRGTLAWLDHWLLELPDAPLPSAKVTSFEMPAATGSWVELDDWPAPTAAPMRWHVRGDGVLGADPGPPGTGSYQVDPADGMPSYWNAGHRPDTSDLVAWHTAREAQRFSVTSEPLTTDAVLAGTPVAQVPASFSAEGGHLVVRLSDVAPDGSSTLVTTGWLNATHRAGHLRATPVAPGEMADHTVELWPSHWRFAEGHRIQLSVSSGDVPRLHPDAPAGTVTLATGEGGAFVDLPLTGTAVRRVAGPTRITTSVAASQTGWPTARRGLLASSEDHPDALAAASLAAALHAPVLLTPPDGLADEVGDELERLGVSEVVLVGGTGALSPQVEADLDARDLSHRRVSGADRFATAAALAQELASVSAGRLNSAVLAVGAGSSGGDAWADALTAGRLAAAAGAPLLLTEGDRLPAATVDALGSLLPDGAEVAVVGGPAAVGSQVVDQLRAGGWSVRRIAGADRYATALAAMTEGLPRGADPRPLLLAAGTRFPDALTAAGLAHQLDGALLLVDPGDLEASEATARGLRDPDVGLESVVVVGGSAAIGGRVLGQVEAALDVG